MCWESFSGELDRGMDIPLEYRTEDAVTGLSKHNGYILCGTSEKIVRQACAVVNHVFA